MYDDEQKNGKIDRPPYTEVQSLDPLNVDDFMVKLPSITKAKQLDKILAKLTSIVSLLDKSILSSTLQGYAALRDFDFLISSADRLSPKSYKSVHGLENILERLGRLTEHTPRGCNFTYGLFNPEDERMRTFTGLEHERLFIKSVQEGSAKLDDGLIIARQLSETEIDSINFTILSNEITAHFEHMTKSVVTVYRNIPPKVFSEQIVIYFSPLDINGTEYIGITGAQIANIALDLIVFGASLEEHTYRNYVERHLPSMLPFHKMVINQALENTQGVSLLQHIHNNVKCKNSISRAQCLSSLDALQKYLKRVLSFRNVHRKLAMQSLPLREIHKGSGGHTHDLLEYLICKTRNASCFIDIIKSDI